MISNPGNPFGFPGAAPDAAANPVLQSLEMMRQMWGSLTPAAPVSPSMGLDELDRRITDLRAIENWLNLNLTMLRGTIQGLEVQRATISTLRSFAEAVGNPYASHDDAGAAAAKDAAPSPLEVVLGLRPAAPSAAAGPAPAPPAMPAAEPPRAEPAANEPGASSAGEAAAPLHGMPAAQAWWSMLQDQFNRIAAATAQTLPHQAAAAPAAQGGAGPAKPSPRPRAGAARKAAGKTAAKAATPTPPAKTARKRAPAKRAARAPKSGA
ncbi:hypothetical protein GCM10023144_05880 [Pigmentiphaga soli]|uniref:Transcriptional regulator n=1 Tax=Pigmentiphaga soli TaxID=1007095 RepID=A0ABP8GH86_9BURK